MAETRRMVTVSVGMDKDGWLCLQAIGGRCMFLSSIDDEERQEVKNFLNGLLK